MALVREAGDSPRGAFAIRTLGLVALYQGRPEEAEPLFVESLGRYRARGERFGMRISLVRLGLVAAAREWVAASEDYAESLDLFRAIGNRGIGISYSCLAELARAREDWDGAAEDTLRRACGCSASWAAAGTYASALVGLASVIAARVGLRAVARASSSRQSPCWGQRWRSLMGTGGRFQPPERADHDRIAAAAALRWAMMATRRRGSAGVRPTPKARSTIFWRLATDDWRPERAAWRFGRRGVASGRWRMARGGWRWVRCAVMWSGACCGRSI
ncbi:MAG: hypothetical protein U0232_11140 [Thermomicrobiales bacterium]